MTSTDLVSDQDVLGTLRLLEEGGAVTPVSLTITRPDLPIEQWQDIGRFLGTIDRASRWWVGDWLLLGEALYGEEASQGVEATQSDRYSEAERVTGLDHGTHMNVASTCNRVPVENRRPELGFWLHTEVAALEPELQREWLQRAVEEGWTRSQLRAELRAPAEEDEAETAPEDAAPEGEHVSIAERIEQAARLVWHQSQRTEDGGLLVPAEIAAQLAAALGEE